MPVIISWILIILALIIILMVIFRKFPVLAILDVANIPGQKEAKFKKRIMEKRVARDLARWSGWLGRIWLFFNKHFSAFLKSRQEQLQKIKISYQSRLKMPWPEKQKRLKQLLIAAEDLLRKENLEEAEKKLVAIISLDQKNLAAFFKLGDLYAKQKKWPEARETLIYALKLARQNKDEEEAPPGLTLSELHFYLAEVEKEVENTAAALENIREALESEPNNPRYLDLIIDLSIMIKDKNLAEEYWQKLAAVNPENQKLGEWQESIEKL